MFKVEKNEIIYEHYPKQWDTWRKKFRDLADQVGQKLSLDVVHGTTGKHHLNALFSRKGKPVSFSPDQINLIREHFTDFH